MVDMEKVINGLESCVISMTKCFYNRNEMCPYASVDVLHCEKELMRDALAMLKEQEAVVRCKDCKFAEPSLLPSKHPWCSIHEFYREPDWFCADGEVR